jgi:hypothetical protein
MADLKDAKAKLWAELYKSRAPLTKAERKAKLEGRELDDTKVADELEKVYTEDMEGYLADVVGAEEARAAAKEMDAEEEEYMKEQSAMRKKDKESNKQLAESLDGKSKDTMSIIKHLSKNIPAESIDEEPDLEIEDSEDDHPILKKKKKMKIFE